MITIFDGISKDKSNFREKISVLDQFIVPTST
jgi:hypothetical protein